MADEKLIFPIGFDLEGGVEQAKKDWKSAQSELANTFKSNTIGVDVNISEKALNKLYSQFESLIKSVESKSPQIKLKMPNTVDFEQEINRLKVQLKSINLGELTDDESKDLYLYIRQLEALAKALKEVNKQEQLRQAKDPANIALRQAQAEEKRTRALANSALADQRKAKIATESARQSEINARSTQREAIMVEQKRAATARSEQAELRLTQAKERSTRATNAQNQAYGTQLSYLQRLAQRMLAYASVTQAMQFLRNIREVTAEFELQRVALGSIIGDLNEANKMFEQIKAAAVKSPFQIKELVSYTKQLAAYKIGTNELFDTTQKLADISAGLGVSMERLVLAYGQIRATGYLRASEVRQLTEAGIPIIEELAKKMSELRGETVSAAEVMGMISERAISFGMVKDVFDDMTSAGGMFYKMQEKQAGTLAGQISNLKDSFSIMYEEMGKTESVSNKMKGMIALIKSLAENWRTVGTIIESVAISMAGYYVSMKNLSVVSQMLGKSEAIRLAIESKQMIIIPKWLSLFDKKNRLYRVAIALEKAYKVAVIKSATATNILSKSFWGLSKAILANPFTALTAVLAGITLAIVKLTTEMVSADDAVKGINASLSEFEKNASATDALMTKYGELAGITNKTNEEQKEYQKTLNELGKMYPEAIESMDKYGNVLELNNGRLEQASAKQREFNKEISESQIKLAESLIPKLEEEIDDAKQSLGKKFFSFWGNYSKKWRFGLFTGDKDQAELLDYIQSLRDEVEKLKQAADEARKKLAGITEEGDGTNLSDTFNTWQKELSAITEGKNLKGEGIRIFDDETIAQTPKLTSALEKVAEKYKKLKEEKVQVDKALKSEGAKADKQTYAQLEERLGKINEGMSGLYDFLKKYGGLDLIKDGDKNGELARLQKELQLHEKIYAKYKEYRKYMSAEEAKAKVEDYFKDTIGSLRFTPSFEKSGYQNVLTQYQDAIKALLAKAKSETEKGAIKKVLLELGFKIDDVNWQAEKDKIEDNLKELSYKLSRTKTAKEFFDRMLGLTGDKQLSATLTMSVYGTTGDDLKQRLIEQVQGAFAGQDLSKAINADLKSIDLSVLRKIYEELPEDFQEKQKTAMKQVLDMLEKQQQDISSSFAKLLMEYDEMGQKRVTITDKATRDIATLEQGLQAQIKAIREDEKITDKDSAIKEAEARADAVRRSIIAKQALDLKKLTPEYLRFFSSINSMSIETANTTRIALRRALFDAFEKGAISAEELRKELKAIDTQFKKLNENSSIFGSYMTGGFDSMLAKLRENADELDAIAARMKHLKSIDEMGDDEKSFVNRMLNLFGGDGKKSLSQLASSFNGNMSKMGDAVQEVGGQMQGMFSGAMGAISIVDMIIKAVHQSVEAIQQVIDQINSMRNEENQIGGWFKYISDFDKYAFSGWERLKSGDVMGAMADTVSSIISIFQNIQADKIENINDRIEEQQKILENLEYSYSRLEKAQEEAFGIDYIANYEQRLANLQAQLDAYQKQLDAEREKGKKSDTDKIEEYQNAIRDTADAMKDMQRELSEHFLGTDLTSAARDFAQAWIDAYKEFGSTTDAMKEKFSDMIENMIVESFAARVIQSALEPIFQDIDAMMKDGALDMSEASRIAELTDVAVGNIDVGMNNLMNALAQAGISVRGMGSDLTGISRDIASASEESILGLAAGINTQNYYISQVPAKMDIIIGLLQGGNVAQGSAITLQDLVTLQNQHLSYLPTIAQHTAETVAECKRTADACENMLGQLRSVIKPNGTQSTHKLNATLSQS